jgi:hypothetical protein
VWWWWLLLVVVRDMTRTAHALLIAHLPTHPGALTVTVCRLYRVTDGGDRFGTADPVDAMHLVEVSGFTGPGRSAAVVGNEIIEFADQLKPCVLLQLFMEDSFRL